MVGEARHREEMSKLTHLDAAGRARMVDVSHKPASRRRAVASGTLTCLKATFDTVLEGRTPKGAVISHESEALRVSSDPGTNRHRPLAGALRATCSGAAVLKGRSGRSAPA